MAKPHDEMDRAMCVFAILSMVRGAGKLSGEQRNV